MTKKIQYPTHGKILVTPKKRWYPIPFDPFIYVLPHNTLRSNRHHVFDMKNENKTHDSNFDLVSEQYNDIFHFQRGAGEAQDNDEDSSVLEVPSTSLDYCWDKSTTAISIGYCWLLIVLISFWMENELRESLRGSRRLNKLCILLKDLFNTQIALC